MKNGDQDSPLAIYFYWICRDEADFESFKSFFLEILAIKELRTHLELNMYVTGEMDLKSVHSEEYNQFSGKPNWNRIFKEKAKKHAGKDIGVFLCGPGPIAAELAAASKKHSSKRSKQLNSDEADRTIFKFHKENF